jgi:hypothetical protein
VHQELSKNGVRTLIGATLMNLVKNLIGEFLLYLNLQIRGESEQNWKFRKKFLFASFCFMPHRLLCSPGLRRTRR